PDNPCEECISSVSQTGWSPDDTNTCDDDSVCTTGDRCEGGHCVGDEVKCQDDNNPCTDSICDPKLGCQQVNNNNECDDGNPCTVGDRCDGGSCKGGGPKTCDDGDPCTDDQCDPNTVDGCVYTGHSRNYNTVDGKQVPIECDLDICTRNDRCSLGKCVPGTDKLACDDGNPCTDDICDPKSGCRVEFNPKGCDDKNACTTGDFCQNGRCLPGPTLKDCNDNNPCTVDSCDPKNGACINDDTKTPTGTPCQVLDENNSYEPDVCAVKGECKSPGTGLKKRCLETEQLSCEDNNPCTVNVCDSVEGCKIELVADNTPCDDKDDCTDPDVCKSGVCQGTPKTAACNDNNPCTIDSCEKDQGGNCSHTPIVSATCNPVLLLVGPARGSMVDGAAKTVNNSGSVVGGFDPKSRIDSTNNTITWTGVVSSNAVPRSSLTLKINGVKTSFNLSTGAFTYVQDAKQGMNLMIVEVEDTLKNPDGTSNPNRVTKVVRSFYYSKTYYVPQISNLAAGMVNHGMQLFLAENPIWTTDFRQIFESVVGAIDFNALIPSPAATQSVLWCDYKVYIKNVTYTGVEMILDTKPGFLFITLKIKGFKANYNTSSGSFCPDFSGQVRATEIVVTTNVTITVNSAGNVTATLEGTQVAINGFSIDDNNWLADLIIGLFQGTIKNLLENELRKTMGQQIPKLLGDAFSQLTFNQSFPIAPFFGTGSPIIVTLSTKPSGFDFTSFGGTFKLKATGATAQIISNHKEGSIGRSNCLGVTESFDLSTVSSYPLRVALHDDVFNQLLYSVWTGGLLRGKPDLGANIPAELSDLTVDVDFQLPPIISGCQTGVREMQIGDIKVNASFKFAGQQVSLLIYASMKVTANLAVVVENGQQKLSIQLSVPSACTSNPTGATCTSWLDSHIFFEIASINQELVGARSEFEKLLREKVLLEFIKGFGGSALGGFPIPEIDLSTLGSGVNKKLKLDVKSLLYQKGYNILSGNLAP
ncbi:MAG: hypothetical protein KC609_21320, partial [Myxococcales bacterium]|nr:hypothetical protein [Myxococcales bacterium]